MKFVSCLGWLLLVVGIRRGYCQELCSDEDCCYTCCVEAEEIFSSSAHSFVCEFHSSVCSLEYTIFPPHQETIQTGLCCLPDGTLNSTSFDEICGSLLPSPLPNPPSNATSRDLSDIIAFALFGVALAVIMISLYFVFKDQRDNIEENRERDEVKIHL